VLHNKLNLIIHSKLLTYPEIQKHKSSNPKTYKTQITKKAQDTKNTKSI